MKNIKCVKERILHLKRQWAVNIEKTRLLPWWRGKSLPLLLTPMILSAALPNCSACGIDSHQKFYLTSRLHITQGEALCSGRRRKSPVWSRAVCEKWFGSTHWIIFYCLSLGDFFFVYLRCSNHLIDFVGQMWRFSLKRNRSKKFQM